jgi:hypothetical protein
MRYAIMTPEPETRLFRVVAPSYVAGFTTTRFGSAWIVTKTAPILRWLRGLKLAEVKEWFEKRAATYDFEEVAEKDYPGAGG